MNKIELKNRILWFDGSISVQPEQVEQYIGIPNLFVHQITPSIEQYNKLVPEKEQITVKTACGALDFRWNLPDEYATLDVYQYIFDKLEDILVNYTDIDAKNRIIRVLSEFDLYKKLNLIDALRTIIYIINKFEANNIIWGVGRGSSVSSYILYVIGVHDIDSVEFNLDIHDFLKSRR